MTARQTAVLCLIEAEKGGYSNLTLKRALQRYKLPDADAAFCAALFYKTLERQITLDYILKQFLTAAPEKLDPEVRAVLRSGLCQICYLKGVPQFAAVNESVRLCKTFKKSSAAGMVNAVLRRAAAADLKLLLEKLDGPEALSVAYSLNQPLCELLLSQYSELAEDIMQGFFAKERRAVRVNTLKTDAATAVNLLLEEGISASESGLEDCLYIDAGNVLKSRLFEDGSLRPQSRAAQTAVHALGPRPGARMLDLCAAPGGKSLTAAQMMRNSGEITAVDRHENRLKLVGERAGAENVSIIKTRKADSAVFMPEYEGAMDFVLADVPCSGYGEICSKPELRLKPPAADGSLIKTQGAVLSNGLRYLKPGGRLVYSTCTVDNRENRDVARGVLSGAADIHIVREREFKGFAADGDGFMTKLPSPEDGEGFFIAVFERTR